MSHTPGPWNDDSMKFTAGWVCLVTPSKPGRQIHVADCRDRPTDDEDAANAQLIAAAPDLLEGCKEALEFLEHEASGTGGEVIITLKAAIAKTEINPKEETL